MTITVYDFDNVLVKTYPNVPIPVKPNWKNDLECLHYLQTQCPVLQFNGVYGITPYYNVEPLYTLEGAIYPEISPLFRSSTGWDLKLTQKWVDINSSKRLNKIEKSLNTQTVLLNEMRNNQRFDRVDRVDLQQLQQLQKFVEIQKMLELQKLNDGRFGEVRYGLSDLQKLEQRISEIQRLDQRLEFGSRMCQDDLRFVSPRCGETRVGEIVIKSRL